MLVIGGTHSGCGKSTVTLGLLAALKDLGHAVQPFKSGPDFIDAGLHGMLAGRPSRNLDIWMCGEDYILDAVKRRTAGAGLAIVEGVMGLYDGAGRSTAALARLLGAKIVLVVDACGMAESAGAVVNGFCSYGEYGGAIKGVIFNRVSSPGHYERLKVSLKGVQALGYLPRDAAYSIPSRHLGLAVAEEAPLDAGALKKLAAAVIEGIDMDRIAELARMPSPVVSAGRLHPAADGEVPRSGRSAPGADAQVRIAVARDKAFCFYYEDNLDMLRAAGAALVPFSPLSDRHLPEGIDAIYLGGGYPEIHADKLSGNKTMLEAIGRWAMAGGPIFAECGGFMYLGEGIWQEGRFYPLCGVFPIKTALAERPVLGYREASLSGDCILGRKGDRIRGHEFHYSRVVEFAERPGVLFNVLGEERISGNISSASSGASLGGYTHLHLGSNPHTADRMVEFIRLRQKRAAQGAAAQGADGK